MTTIMNASKKGNVMITDLDDDEPPAENMDQAQSSTLTHKVLHRKRQSVKMLNTVSGNFNRRSRSADVNVEQRFSRHEPPFAIKTGKVQSYFNELLQAKDRQMEQLLQRLSTLHKFNEEFAEQNDKLRCNAETMTQQIKTLQRKVSECDHCYRLSQQLESATTHCEAYEADLDMMQTLIYRLNVQIEYYQDKLRINSTQSTVGEFEMKISSLTSTATPRAEVESLNRSTITPLLHAYDEMLREKQDLIQQYRQNFDHFTGELKRVLEENNRLLECNETQKRDVGGWREERMRLQTQLDVCRAKAESQIRKADLAKEQLVEVMHCYEQKVQSLMLDAEHLQSAYTRCKAELATLKSAATQPQELISGSLQECKELLEQLKQEHSKEKQIMERAITELTQRSGEYSANLHKQLLTNERLQHDIKQLQVTKEELQKRVASIQHVAEKVKRSRDRLKTRLRIALQWAQKLEEGQANIQTTWDALKRLEAIVKHKESQVRGLHARHLQEIEKLQHKLNQKEDTIRTILKGKLNNAVATGNNATMETT